MLEDRRSGLDRRKQASDISEDRRNGKDRRTVLRDLNQTIQKYKKIPLFKNLTTEQLTKMLRICSKKKYQSMEHIYHFGEESKNMFILLKGRISLTFDSGVQWQSITPQEIVGEMGVFTGGKRSASVIADPECIVLVLNKEEMFRLFNKDLDLYNKILLNVIKDMSQKMRRDNDQIEELLNRIRLIDIV